uniref:Gliding motility protein MglA n=1 Tax=uncultured bacterium A1Q1_fos_18 TaxID=1256551 RepID=L7VVR7_9BACT|nr:gliding motility protein MglA [uncultured bacterium A1Q1_fos_18]
MPQLYSQAREVLLKLVFYGPAGAGKTSALTQLHKLLRPDVRGQIVSVNTGADRTLFFDFFPPPPPLLGAPVHAQVFAGSGTVQNESTRRALLAGCDGVLFVWDSRRGREAENTAAMEELRTCLSDLGVKPQDVPLVVAWNKRDLSDAVPLSDLEPTFGIKRAQSVPMIARTGQSVFDAFRVLATEALEGALRKRPELAQSGAMPTSDLSFGNDMVTARRMLAAQEAQMALRSLVGRYTLDQPLRIDESALAREQAGRSQEMMPVSGLSAPPLPALEQSNDALAAVKLDNPTGAQVLEETLRPRPNQPLRSTPRPSDPTLAQPGLRPPGGAALDKTMPGTRIPQRSKPPLAPTPPKMESSTRDQGISLLLSPGPMRAQVQEVERLIQSTQFVQAVRRSMSIFFSLQVSDTTRDPDEGPAWRALALGLPADRYLRFRQVGQSADASRSTVEDAMFALFFLVDAVMRKESTGPRGS